MKKFVLGAGAALALMVSRSEVSAQSPAPVVPAMPESTPSNVADLPSMPLNGGFLPSPYASYTDGLNNYADTRFYTETSYLLMFVSDSTINQPLLTNGLIGAPNTAILAGNRSTDYDTASGFRIGFGGLNGGTSIGVDVNGFYLGRVSDSQSFGPTSASVLARPFFDTSLRSENAKVIAAPGAFNGGFTVDSSLQAWGAEINPYYRVVQGNTVSFDVITGFRYFSMNERLNLFDATTVLSGGTSAFNGIGLGQQSVLVTNDKFSAQNNFYGINLGSRLSFTRGALFLDLTGKVALGGVGQRLNVDGSTTLVSGGGLVGAATTPGGFFANPTLTGTRSENRFAVLPEGNITLGYQLSSWLNVFAGYQVMYISNVARPQEQLVRNFASSNLPTLPTYSARGLNSQAVDLGSSDLFLHGFSFGFTLTY